MFFIFGGLINPTPKFSFRELDADWLVWLFSHASRPITAQNGGRWAGLKFNFAPNLLKQNKSQLNVHNLIWIIIIFFIITSHSFILLSSTVLFRKGKGKTSFAGLFVCFYSQSLPFSLHYPIFPPSLASRFTNPRGTGGFTSIHASSFLHICFTNQFRLNLSE